MLSVCGVEIKPTVLALVPAVSALADNVHPAMVPNVDVRDAVVMPPEIFTFDAVRVPEKVADAAFKVPVRVELLDKTTLLVPVEDVTPVPPLATEMVPDVIPPASIDAETLELADIVADATVPVTREPAIDDAVSACVATVAEAALPEIVLVTVRLDKVPNPVRLELTIVAGRVVPVSSNAFIALAVLA